MVKYRIYLFMFYFKFVEFILSILNKLRVKIQNEKNL